MTLSIIDQKSPTCQAPPSTPTIFSPTTDESTRPVKAMAQYNPFPNCTFNRFYYKKGISIEKRYGVPQTRRILTVGMFHKYHHEIRHELLSLGLETRERDAIFKLLELYIHYGRVYPKAADIAEQSFISKRTFWRAIGKLRELGVIEVLNRYANHKQISNAYRLDKLVVILARYLMEHGHDVGKWGRLLVMFFNAFWDQIWNADINLSLAAPIRLGLNDGWGR